MRKQIVAVTADNADLKKRLSKSMQETLDIDKENKELKAYKVRAAKALDLLAKLERENPSVYNALFESKQKPPVPSFHTPRDIFDNQLKSLARVLLPIMREYLSSEQGQKDFAEWQQSQLNKQSNNKESR